MTTKRSLLSAAFCFLIAASGAAPAGSHGSRAPEGSREPSASGLIYTNRAFSQAVYSYLNVGDEPSIAKPELRYVSLAYGPSLYSYPRMVPDTVTAFNVQFISNAYGPAIYSYPGLYQQRGNVQILPFLND
jgi:RNA recognition motif-containing protein